MVLVVNTASQCGLTPQYEALQALYEKHKDQGFVVVGIPANKDYLGYARAIEGLGSHGTMRIKYQGGEPTLRADFRTICQASQAAGILQRAVR